MNLTALLSIINLSYVHVVDSIFLLIWLYTCEALKNVVDFVNKYDRFWWRRGFQIQSSEQMSQGIY